MDMPSLTDIKARPTYEPTGGAAWPTLALFTPALLFVAFLLGSALFGVNLTPAAGILYPTLFASLILSAAAFYVIGESHCRSPLFAAVFGGALGFFMYLSQFHFGMTYEQGLNHVVRLDLLPEYLATTVSNWKVDEHGKSVVFNWIVFAMEFSCAVLCPGFLSWLMATFAYCERCSAWMKRGAAFLSLGDAALLERALNDQFELLPRVSTALDPNAPQTAAIMERCEHPGFREEPVTYLTVLGDGGIWMFWSRRISQAALSNAECLQLLGRIPQLTPRREPS